MTRVSTNLREFSSQLDAAGKDLDREFQDLQQRATFAFADHLIDGIDQVRTGRAKGSVVVSLGRPRGTDPRRFDKTGSATKAAAQQVAQQIRPYQQSNIEAGNGGAFHLIFLNDGTPHMAGRHMFEAAGDAVVAKAAAGAL